MANITYQFSLQTLEGPNSNVVTLARSAVQTITLTNRFEQQINIPINTPSQITNFPTIASKVISIENVGSADVTVQINGVGTTYTLPKANGTNTNFIVLSTTTGVTSLTCGNADVQNQGQLIVFIGG